MEQTNHFPWSNTEKFTLRFFLIFFATFCLNNSIIPFVSDYWTKIGHTIGHWFKGVLWGMNQVVDHENNGGGDTSDDYAVQLFFFLVALLGASLWTLIDRKPRNYDVLYYWVRVVIRYCLGLTMILYGLAKVIPNGQFGFPGLTELTSSLGSLSPMGLAWQFFGYSYPYSFFGGLMELIGGILLFFRRTTLVGTLLLITVLSNVVMINLSYNVSVKLYSSIYLLMAIFLLAKDAKRLWDFFWAENNIEFTPTIDTKWYSYTKITIKSLLFIMAIVNPIYQIFFAYGDESSRKKSTLHGIYDVEKFEVNRKEHTLILNDTTIWKRLIIGESFGSDSYEGKIMLSIKKGIYTYYEINDTTKAILINSRMDSTQNFVGNYTKPDSSSLIIEGIRQKDTLKILLKKAPMPYLEKKNFHWITE